MNESVLDRTVKVARLVQRQLDLMVGNLTAQGAQDITPEQASQYQGAQAHAGTIGLALHEAFQLTMGEWPDATPETAETLADCWPGINAVIHREQISNDIKNRYQETGQAQEIPRGESGPGRQENARQETPGTA